MKTENFNQFYYPMTSEGAYFDFSNGGSVSQTTINVWIQRAFDLIGSRAKREPDRDDFCYNTSTGNTKLTVEAYRQTNGKFTVYVSVSTKYEQQTGMDIEF